LFLDIEKTRFDERLEFSFLIEQQAEKALIPSLLLQPIIENSMKHVIAKNENGGAINVSAKVLMNDGNNKLVITINDTGSDQIIDINKLISEDFSGVGLHNVKDRLALIFENNYSFNMSLLPSGALQTTIEIPCNYQTDNNPN